MGTMQELNRHVCVCVYIYIYIYISHTHNIDQKYKCANMYKIIYEKKNTINKHIYKTYINIHSWCLYLSLKYLRDVRMPKLISPTQWPWQCLPKASNPQCQKRAVSYWLINISTAIWSLSRHTVKSQVVYQKSNSSSKSGWGDVSRC